MKRIIFSVVVVAAISALSHGNASASACVDTGCIDMPVVEPETPAPPTGPSQHQTRIQTTS